MINLVFLVEVVTNSLPDRFLVYHYNKECLSDINHKFKYNINIDIMIHNTVSYTKLNDIQLLL